MLSSNLQSELLFIRTVNKLVLILIIIIQALSERQCDLPLQLPSSQLPTSAFYSSAVEPLLDAIVQPIFSDVSPIYATLITSQPWPPDYGPTILGKVHLLKGLCEFDFIVVGAGSAGAIVASRLSEITGWSVLLIEAGGDPPLESVIPSLYATMYKTKVDWKFMAKSPNVCKISGDRGCYMARGKMLGGTSSMNFMLYVRGTAEDFNEWARLGNKGWSFADVLPYFKKSEGNKDKQILARDKNGTYHSSDGPVKIDRPTNNLIVNEVFNAGLKQAGADFVVDINDGKNLGFLNVQLTAYRGIRSSTAQEFLVPYGKRSNFKIIKNGYVNRVLLDENNVARGVEFTIKGKHTLVCHSKKEVIISAGTIQSPTLLMRSGIGPENHLKERNIPVKANLPVGENLRDHITVTLIFKSDIPSNMYSPLDAVTDLNEYVLHRSGNFAGISYMIGRIDTTNSTGLPDIQYYITSVPKSTPKFIIRNNNKANNFESLDDLIINANQHYVLTYVAVVAFKPKSVGSIKLDASTLEADITSGYLTEEEDTETLLRGIRRMTNLVSSPALQQYGTDILRIPLPECDALGYDSDDYWKCFIRYCTCQGAHQVGTCKMGVNSESVVDPNLRVYKTAGLRVIDSSIMPDIIRANTNAAAMMIGEKGADLIKMDHLNF